MLCIIIQEGVSAICFALTVGPDMVKVMLSEFQCNPKFVTAVSH